MIVRSRVARTVLLSVLPLVAGLWGCEAPPDEAAAVVKTGGGNFLSGQTPPQYMMPRSRWLPIRGRLSPWLTARHGLEPTAGGRPMARPLLAEHFSRFELPNRQCQRIGEPNVALPTDPRQGRFCRLSPADVDAGRNGLVWRVPLGSPAPGVLRVSVLTRQTRPRVGQLLGMPRFEVHVGPQRVALPLSRYASRGWERQGFYVPVPADATEVFVAVFYEGGGAAIGLDDLEVLRADDEWAARSLRPIAEGANLLPGADFEVGQKLFAVRGGPWAFDRSAAASGRTSLRLDAAAEPVTLQFAPVALAGRTGYTLSFNARTTGSAVLRCRLHAGDGQSHVKSVRIEGNWQRYRALFVVGEAAARRLGAVTIERPGAVDQPVWLDAVALHPGATDAPYAPPNPVEIGLIPEPTAPVDDPLLRDARGNVRFTVRLVSYAPGGYHGWITLDVIDAFDRAIWTRPFRRQTLGPGQVDEPIELTLGRGYYRVLATAWSGQPASSRPLSRAEMVVGLIDRTDAVPVGSYFGLDLTSLADARGAIDLGAGWVRYPYAGPTVQPAAANLELAGWVGAAAADSAASPASQPARSGRLVAIEARFTAGEAPAASPLAELRRRGETGAWLVGAGLDESHIAGLDRADPQLPAAVLSAADFLAVRRGPGDEPEDHQDLVERLRRLRRQRRQTQVWFAVTTPPACGALLTQPVMLSPTTESGALAAVRIDTFDEALAASRLVRAMVLGQLAAAERTAWRTRLNQWPDLTDGPLSRGTRRFDGSPTAPLVAYDYAAGVLNDARLVEWIDKPGEVRMLCFEKRDGSGVVLAWRPFGRREQRFALDGLAGQVAVTDVMGAPCWTARMGADLLLPVNAYVRYVLAPSARTEPLFRAAREAQGVATDAGYP